MGTLGVGESELEFEFELGRVMSRNEDAAAEEGEVVGVFEEEDVDLRVEAVG